MQYLPNLEEQAWLLTRLSELIAGRGKEPFLDTPIVEPTPEFFPDPWTFTHRGLDRLTRRLMRYAGLGQLDVRIGTYRERDAGPLVRTEHQDPSAAGVFLGIEEGCCVFAFNEKVPSDAEFMAGVMCHEVAHAYRAFHGLRGTSPEEEEEHLTDLTTVYLGFGILATNNSHRFRQRSWVSGGAEFSEWSRQSAGYLPPQAFAYLLATQMVARALPPRERRRLLKRLEGNQAVFVKAALKAVRRQERDILGVLRLAPDAGRDAPKRPVGILAPLPEYVAPEAEAGVHWGSEPARSNEGRPVFRLTRRRVGPGVGIGSLVGLVAGAVAAVLWRMPSLWATGLLLGGLVGACVGHLIRREICSDPGCEAVLTDDDRCPKCQGIIAGSIWRADDRLAAEEEWERRRKG